MDPRQLLLLALVIISVAVALALGRFIPRFGREFPWIVVLCIYFTLRAAKRALDFVQGNVPVGPDLWLDLVLLPVAILLLLSARRMTAGFAAAHDEAEYRRREYERARRDYQQLVRHRLFNPLTVIRGAAITLQAGVPDDRTRDALLDAIREAADAIQHTTLEPEQQGGEEQSLDAIPRVPG